MNNIKKSLLASTLSIISFGRFAETISSWGTTVTSAEEKKSKITEESGSKYKIITARMENYDSVTATLTK
ncbi:hypothetical protein [Providencia burhodogranariea]|uniref:DUF1471 domain-containing protein n=1 Tax=Providencia burhodogranariea DSM 19968 TaxID=1141662 RepID=K8WQ35_9GAMM|nr:hypothetical protein [Providencia burhodogranariea]EKT59582.1 hypothetical protein OOA_12942 [Providencia burhodogranariea DSM 19968]